MEVIAKILLFTMLRDKYKVKEVYVRCNGAIQSLIKNAAKILGDSFISDVLDNYGENVRDDLVFMINGGV